LSGLSGIVITLKDKTVSFNYNPSVISLSAIIAAIADEGFDVTG
jgi:copper chaperone CopZ